jgi:L-ascorbate metabolism protein UlaG (beta-lactamase superfamily)
MLPPAELLSYRPYDKKTDSAISATGLPAASSGEGYIITLEDGRFVIIDSGNTKSGTETENFRKALWDLHERNSGAPVSSSNPVRVAAWLITHSHDDHYNIFVEMLKLKGKSGELYVDYVIGNFPCGTELGNTGGDYTMTTKIDEYRSLLRIPFTFIKAHTGQKLYFANMEIETLYTHEDLNPHNIVTFNDSSTIMRLTINVTGGEPVTLMSTGDAYRYAGRWACAMYGTTLRSDMVTMAHHGGPAVEELFYTYVAPTVIWWPHNSRSVHTGYLKQDNRHSLVDQHAYNLPSVKYVYCSGDDHNTTLYLRADGPAYDELYNAGFGTALDYDQYHCIKK